MSEIQLTVTTENFGDIEIHFPDDALTMSLPVTELGDGLFRLEAVPFMTEAANLRDIVELKRRADGSLEFVRVVEPSNWRVFTFMMSLEQAEGAQTREFCARLNDLGCYWERSFGGCLLVGVPPRLDLDPNDLLARVVGTVH